MIRILSVMATALGNDNFVIELNRVRENVRSIFNEIMTNLRVREETFMGQLDNILLHYESYRTALDKYSEREKQVRRVRNLLLEGTLCSSGEVLMNEELLKEMQLELEMIRIPKEPRPVKFECVSYSIISEIRRLGKLVEQEIRILTDYEKKSNPTISIHEQTKVNEWFYRPRALAVDDATGNIYVIDRYRDCIQVLDRFGDYLFNFGGTKITHFLVAVGGQRGIAIHNNSVLLSKGDNQQFNYNKVLEFNANGNFIAPVNRYNNGKWVYYCPGSMAFDKSNGDVYFLELKSDSVHVITKEFALKQQFGGGILKQPRDIKLTREHIYVLDTNNRCLNVFSFEFFRMKNVISRGIGMQVVNPYFFTIDSIKNVIISDCGSNSIRIFNPNFEFIHEIALDTSPMGISVDNEGRIIVICQNYWLHIF